MVPVTIRTDPLAGFLAPTSDTMPEDALKVRPSSYASYSLCSYRLLLMDEEGYDAGSNEAPGWGTGAHSLIEHFLTTGEIFQSHEDIVDHWRIVMKERGEDIDSYANAQTLAVLAVELKHAFMVWLNTYWQEVGQHLNILAIEQRVNKGLGVLPSGREVWVSGAPDLVSDGRVTDWKTAGRGWKSGKAGANLVQIATYAWLSEWHTQATEGSFVVYDRAKRTWAWDDLMLPLTPDNIRASLVAMWDMARSLDSGIGVATPHVRGGFGDGRGWHCTPKFCGAWNPCTHKSLFPDGRDKEVRPPIRWEAE